MSYSLKKWIAVLLTICLPLVGGNSLAASIAMQQAQEPCHEMSLEDMQLMPGHSDTTSSDHPSDSACSHCGLCQLACSGYMSEAAIITPTLLQAETDLPHYLLSFYSITSTPLLPPPLSRA